MNVADQANNRDLISIEEKKAISEVQAQLIIAKKFPRDELEARVKILKSCESLRFAESALFAYPRGGKTVKGVTIRMAEELARLWGNLKYGFKEVSRNEGYSEVESYAWDLETNVLASRSFQVKHWRDTKSGGYKLKDERDIYELVANMAQRRARACILEAIPAHIVEDAKDQCLQAIAAGPKNKSLDERKRDLVKAFSEIGVTKQMIEDYLGFSFDEIVAENFTDLSVIYKSIKSGDVSKADFFGSNVRKDVENETSQPKQADESTPVETEKPEPKEDALKKVTDNAKLLTPYLISIGLLQEGQAIKDLSAENLQSVQNNIDDLITRSKDFQEKEKNQPEEKKRRGRPPKQESMI
jgi:hypothetical protein